MACKSANVTLHSPCASTSPGNEVIRSYKYLASPCSSSFFDRASSNAAKSNNAIATANMSNQSNKMSTSDASRIQSSEVLLCPDALPIGT